jgi:FG-GAP-like repeat
MLRRPATLCLIALAVHACGGGDSQPPKTPPAPAREPVAAAPRREPLVGGPYPALMLAQAQFVDRTGPDGKTTSAPGPAKLVIARRTESGWKPVVVEDPDSNVFHKALQWDGGVLTIGGTQALLRTWRVADGQWTTETRWNPKFGGKFDRLRDVERGDVDGDGKDELVIATHDQGVIAVVHPDDGWRVEEVDRTPDTFVHEIEIGDVDGDGVPEFFATPSAPNKLDQEQPGEVRMYRRTPQGWQKSIVDAPGDTHAKEILTADVDGDGVSELYVSWEGAVGAGNTLVRPVTVKQYRWKDGKPVGTVVGTVPDRLMRAMAAGDVNGDGKTDLVAGAMSSGLWLFEQSPDGWKRSQIDAGSSGFEHPVLLADLDGDGALEIYVASEDQQELRQYRWKNGTFEKSVVMPLHKGDITWNLTAGRL